MMNSSDARHFPARCAPFPAGFLSITVTLLALMSISVARASQPEAPHAIPLLVSAVDGAREGLLRVVNHSEESGVVHIHGTDDEGEEYGPVTLDVEARASVMLRVRDLEAGNASKGLSDGLGDGEGDWRLRLRSALDIEAGAYVRNAGSLIAETHAVVRAGAQAHHVPFFNPGSNLSRGSWLRLANPGQGDVTVTVRGRDDAGDETPPGDEVRLVLLAGSARTLGAKALENGGADFEGRLGDGAGKWQLFVSADGPVEVMNLMQSADGHLASLSAPGLRSGDGAGPEREYAIPLLVSAVDGAREGLLRVVNRSEESGVVHIHGTDDEGEEYGPVTLDVEARASVMLRARDLESGNASKGLSDGLGDGEGDWRLRLRSVLDIEAGAYVRNAGSLIAETHAVVRAGAQAHHVPLFNPGSNLSRGSRLRLVNPGQGDVTVTVRGRDDAGEETPPEDEVRLVLPAGSARTLGAQALENGGADFEGRLGDGAGKWQLFVSADGPVEVMNLMQSADGHLANLSAGSEPGPEMAADLVVESPAVSDARPAPGAAFTLSATVRNAGDAPSPVTVLRYFRSADAAITASDRPLGSDAVTGLDASGSTSASAALRAPSASGTYYYGACVDAVAGESDPTNNCSAAVAIDAEESEPEVTGRPDLVVMAPSVSDPDPVAGANFRLSVTVRNAGDGSSPSATLRYYRSDDSNIAPSDTPEGNDRLTAFGASGSGSRSVELSAPSVPGTYYYGACVEAVEEESDTTNNCSEAAKVDVPDAEPLSTGRPNLTIAAFSVAADPGGVYANDALTLSATVRNDGDGASAAATLRYYRSNDSGITSEDTEVGTDAVSGLAASASGSESVELNAPSTPGTYYYGACVDAVSGESDTTNNCSGASEVRVLDRQRPPDLSVGQAAVDDASPRAGAGFTLSATVRNDGTGAAATTTLRYYRSSDVRITSDDTEVGTDAVGALSASGTSAESIALTAPSSPGGYYYGACVDAVAEESSTTNNCSASAKVEVAAPPKRPDLSVGQAAVDDASPRAGAGFRLSATVRNDGDGAAATTTLRYYRSSDVRITSEDTEVGTDAVGALSASGTSAESIALTAPSSPGRYYYGACVDAVAEESSTTNNCSASAKVEVAAPPKRPDLSVGQVEVDDASLRAGAGFTLSATVQNWSAGAAAATTLRYYRSSDARITSDDTEVGTDAVRTLSASTARVESIALTAPSTPGTYYYGACLDSVSGESDTTNNCSASVKVDVEEVRNYSELVMSVGAQPLTLTAGESLKLTATVRNEGDVASGKTKLRFYRALDTALTSGTRLGSVEEMGALGAEQTSVKSITTVTPSTADVYTYGACVEAVAGEPDTDNNCDVSYVVVLTSDPPDVWLTTGAEPRAVQKGTAVEVWYSVSNRGRAFPGKVTVRIYRSDDATISTSDTLLGTRSIAVNKAGDIRTSAPSSTGTYYYGACVDAVSGETNTANNCSDGTGVLVTDRRESGVPDMTASASVSPVNVEAGDTITISATASNVGQRSSWPTKLTFHRAELLPMTNSDPQVGSAVDIGVLAAGGSASGSIETAAPSTPGTYYYAACVAGVPEERAHGNNCSGGSSVVVGTANVDPVPDLRVLQFYIPTRFVSAGDTLRVYASAKNYGGVSSSATTMYYYQSDDSTVSTSNTQVATRSVAAIEPGGLEPGAQDDRWITLTAPSTPGTYYYGVCVGTVTGEKETDNNCSGSRKMLVR